MDRDVSGPSEPDLPPGWGTVASGMPEDADGAERHAPDRVRPVDLRDYARFDPERPVRVRILATDVLTTDLWCLEPRQATDPLNYEDADVSYAVLGGTAWFTTDEGEVGLGPLGAILVPAGVGHTIDNRAVDPLVVLASASPPDTVEPAVDAPVADTSQAITLPREEGLLTRLRRTFGGRPDTSERSAEEPPT